MRSLVVALIVIAVVAGYLIIKRWQDRVTEGVVIAKRYEEAHSWTQYIHQQIGKTTTIVPIVHHDDEDWVLTVRGTSPSGKVRERDVEVPEELYNTVKIGDLFVIERR